MLFFAAVHLIFKMIPAKRRGTQSPLARNGLVYRIFVGGAAGWVPPMPSRPPPEPPLTAGRGQVLEESENNDTKKIDEA